MQNYGGVEGEERDMLMIANSTLAASEVITPFIEPIACSLHSSLLSTHCYSCFRYIDEPVSARKHCLVTYCSDRCELIDSHLYDRSGEHQLLLYLKENPEAWPVRHPLYQDNCYLRLALRLLLILPSGPVYNPDRTTTPDAYFPFPPRFLGLCWIHEDEYTTVWKADSLMNLALSVRDGKNCSFKSDFLARRVFTMVLSNALKVSFDTHVSGVALYDYRLSWINHSCVPNSEVNFRDAFQVPETSRLVWLIEPSRAHVDCSPNWFESPNVSAPCKVSDIPGGFRNYGPRASVKTISVVKQGEEVTISYIDSSQSSVVVRKDKLSQMYRFSCACKKCIPWEIDEEDDAALGRCSSEISSLRDLEPEIEESRSQNTNNEALISQDVEKKRNSPGKTLQSFRKYVSGVLGLSRSASRRSNTTSDDYHAKLRGICR